MISDRGTYSAAHVARLRRAGHDALCSVPWSDFKLLFQQHRERLFWNNASYLSVEQKRRRQANSSLPKEHYQLAVLRHQLTDPDTGDLIPCRVIFVFSSADQKVCQIERERAVAKIRAGLERIVRSVARGHVAWHDPVQIQRRVVKLFGKQDRELEQFSDRAERVRDIGVTSAMYARVLFVALGLVASVGTAIVYYVGGNLVISGSLSIGTVAAFAVYVTQIYQPLTQLTNARVDVLTTLVSFERVFEVLDFAPLVYDRPGAFDLVAPKGRVELDHVWFRHPPAAVTSLPSLQEGAVADDEEESGWILRDVSLVIEPGELVALVGPSGAGKTTTAMLVPRIADVSEGRVLLDGHDVRDLTLDSVRDAVGFVMQDPHLFHDTIINNLRYARSDATDDEIVAACKAARINDLIMSLPEGYGTIVGERGYRMSGGEKQRLAIARMLLKDPAIVILDEATSHLDSESELAIQRALAEALRGRTALVIAHRLSTIVNADRILVMDEGRIVEQGRHAELLRERGLYADLYRTQLDRAAEPA